MLMATALSGCAAANLPQPQPDAPTLSAQMLPPPMPPRVIAMPEQTTPPPPKDGIVRLSKSDRVGASWHVPAGEDRVYNISVGLGTNTSGPQQAVVEMPPGEQVQFVTYPNEELLSAKYMKIGNARDWRWIVIFKPLQDTGGPRVENVSILTEKGHYRVDVHVRPGRINNMTLKLLSAAGAAPASMTSGIASDALCLDNAFTWDRTEWWAPINVCAVAMPNGTYQTLIHMDPRVQDFPVVHAFSNNGDGTAAPGIVNYRVSGTTISVDGVHPGLRLTGDGVIDIIRAGGGA